MSRAFSIMMSKQLLERPADSVMSTIHCSPVSAASIPIVPALWLSAVLPTPTLTDLMPFQPLGHLSHSVKVTTLIRPHDSPLANVTHQYQTSFWYLCAAANCCNCSSAGTFDSFSVKISSNACSTEPASCTGQDNYKTEKAIGHACYICCAHAVCSRWPRPLKPYIEQ